MDFLIRYGWYFLLGTIAGEILIPLILAPFYKGYNHSTTALSVLGSVGSPVRFAYNLWMFAAGALFLLSLPALYYTFKTSAPGLGVACVVCVAAFAVGACLFSCFFSVNQTKDTVTTASTIHGIGSAIGFMLLLLAPLFIAILFFKQTDTVLGAVCAASFALALLCFVLFVMADKPSFKGTIIAKEGLWQRLCLLFMYLPLAAIALANIAASNA